jgi:hypothetical protein
MAEVIFDTYYINFGKRPFGSLDRCHLYPCRKIKEKAIRSFLSGSRKQPGPRRSTMAETFHSFGQMPSNRHRQSIILAQVE